MSASFGDCKHTNSGKHNGYDCPLPVVDPPANTGTGGGTDVPTVVNDPTTIIIS